MVGCVGYAPTTPAMSMQYSTIELTAPKKLFLSYHHYFLVNIFKFELDEYKIAILIQKRVNV